MKAHEKSSITNFHDTELMSYYKASELEIQKKLRSNYSYL